MVNLIPTMYFISLILICLPLALHGGIVGLSKFLRSQFKASWVKDINKKTPLEVDHLCIDMNQVLHGCFRTTRKPDHIMAKIFINLDDILRIVTPRKSLVLAFDGPAPFAKLQTQRKRRKSHPESSLITPGTDFMNSMENVMICYTLQRFRRPNFKNVTIFISDARCPGEGELKIIDWIQQHMPQAPYTTLETNCEAASTVNLTESQWKAIGDSMNIGSDATITSSTEAPTTTTIHADDSVLICGSDSDIIVQSVCMGSISPNTQVLQLSADGVDAVCNVSNLVTQLVTATGIDWRQQLAHQLLDASSNSNSVEKHANVTVVAGTAANNELTPVPPQVVAFTSADVLRLRSVHLDLVVLFSLQGNDYLPKMRSMGMLRALTIYGRSMQQLPVEDRFLIDEKRKTFNFKALWLFMKNLSTTTEKSGVPLPVLIPTAAGYLNLIIQRMRNINSNSSSNSNKNASKSKNSEGSNNSSMTSGGGGLGVSKRSSGAAAVTVPSSNHIVNASAIGECDDIVWEDLHIAPSSHTQDALLYLHSQRLINASFRLEFDVADAFLNCQRGRGTGTTGADDDGDDGGDSCAVILESAGSGVFPSDWTVMGSNKNGVATGPAGAAAGRGGMFVNATLCTGGLWRATAKCFGKHYVSQYVEGTKKAARQLLAEEILQDIDEAVYEEYLAARIKARATLRTMRRAVDEEAEARARVVSQQVSLLSSEQRSKSVEGEDDDDGIGDSVRGSFIGDDVAVESDEERRGTELPAKSMAQTVSESLYNRNEVQDKDYLSYLRDSDVEIFLNGLLWIVDMYSQGSCPDLSYTYVGRPPITAYSVQEYIERSVLNAHRLMQKQSKNSLISTSKSSSSSASENDGRDALEEDDTATAERYISQLSHTPDVVDYLRQYVHVPESDQRPLSASATCLSVLSDNGYDYLPHRLRSPWKWMRAKYYSKFDKGMLCSSSYQSLLDALDQCIEAHESGQAERDLDAHSTDNSSHTKNTNSTAALNASLSEGIANSGTAVERKVEEPPIWQVDASILSNRRIKSEIRSSRSAMKRKAAQLKYINTWASIAAEGGGNGGGGYNGRRSSIKKESTAGDVSDSQKKNSSSMEFECGLDAAVVPDVYDAWTIVSNFTTLRRRGYRGNYRSKRLRLPLPVSFHTPRRLPEGCTVLRAEEELCAGAINRRILALQQQASKSQQLQQAEEEENTSHYRSTDSGAGTGASDSGDSYGQQLISGDNADGSVHRRHYYHPRHPRMSALSRDDDGGGGGSSSNRRGRSKRDKRNKRDPSARSDNQQLNKAKRRVISVGSRGGRERPNAATGSKTRNKKEVDPNIKFANEGDTGSSRSTSDDSGIIISSSTSNADSTFQTSASTEMNQKGFGRRKAINRNDKNTKKNHKGKHAAVFSESHASGESNRDGIQVRQVVSLEAASTEQADNGKKQSKEGKNQRRRPRIKFRGQSTSVDGLDGANKFPRGENSDSGGINPDNRENAIDDGNTSKNKSDGIGPSVPSINTAAAIPENKMS